MCNTCFLTLPNINKIYFTNFITLIRNHRIMNEEKPTGISEPEIDEHVSGLPYTVLFNDDWHSFDDV